MYVTLRDRPGAPETGTPVTTGGRRRRVAGTVLALGFVSMLTDISSESVNAVLPVYLTSVLGLSVFAYGVVDGLYQGISALVRIVGGWLADRTDRPKWVAFIGYAASALSRVLLLPAAGLAAVSATIMLDRLGKGLRTAPRDALITDAADPRHVGRAFGVHRALDTLGALTGPLLAFGILLLVPGDFHSVFVASLAFAAIGVAVLLFAVPDRRPRRRAAQQAAADRAPRESAGTGDADRPDAATTDPVTDEPPAAPAAPSFRLLADRRLLGVCVAVGLLGLLTVSDGFLYLALSERNAVALNQFPLLLVGTNAAYLVLAIPLGRLADRIGRVPVLLGGHVLLLLAYLCAAGPWTGGALTLATLLLLGSYYAATDGVLAALAGAVCPVGVRASGIATAQTVQALARFGSSLIFGLLWTQVGRIPATLVFAGLLLVALPVAMSVLRLARDRAPSAATMGA